MGGISQGRASDDSMNATATGFVSAIVLAAGLSSRFGRPKQLAMLEGKSLVRRAAEALVSAGLGEVIVVVGHRAAEVARELGGMDTRIVFNKNYRAGMGSSLKAGLAKVRPESRAVLVVLADQPFITTRLIRRILLVHRRTGSDVVASSSAGVVSPPVLFSSSLYGELAMIRDGAGARAVIEDHPGHQVVNVRARTLFDIDTESDLARARRALRPG